MTFRIWISTKKILEITRFAWKFWSIENYRRWRKWKEYIEFKEKFREIIWQIECDDVLHFVTTRKDTKLRHPFLCCFICVRHTCSVVKRLLNATYDEPINDSISFSPEFHFISIGMGILWWREDRNGIEFSCWIFTIVNNNKTILDGVFFLLQLELRIQRKKCIFELHYRLLMHVLFSKITIWIMLPYGDRIIK